MDLRDSRILPAKAGSHEFIGPSVSALLSAQNGRWIQLQRPPRRDAGCRERYDRQAARDDHEWQRIERDQAEPALPSSLPRAIASRHLTMATG
jgi:hypothetical protein